LRVSPTPEHRLAYCTVQEPRLSSSEQQPATRPQNLRVQRQVHRHVDKERSSLFSNGVEISYPSPCIYIEHHLLNGSAAICPVVCSFLQSSLLPPLASPWEHAPSPPHPFPAPSLFISVEHVGIYQKLPQPSPCGLPINHLYTGPFCPLHCLLQHPGA